MRLFRRRILWSLWESLKCDWKVNGKLKGSNEGCGNFDLRKENYVFRVVKKREDIGLEFLGS